MALTIKLLILIVTLIAIFSRLKNKALFIILITASLNILLTDVFVYFELKTRLHINIYVIVSQFLWLHLLTKRSSQLLRNSVFGAMLIGLGYQFLQINILNTFFNQFFVFTALLYVVVFLYILFKKLNDEDFSFFNKNTLLLYGSPVLYFLGMSLIFGFKSRVFTDIMVFDNVSAFRFINFVSNLILYSLLLLYIFKAKQKVIKVN